MRREGFSFSPLPLPPSFLSPLLPSLPFEDISDGKDSGGKADPACSSEAGEPAAAGLREQRLRMVSAEGG